MSGAWDAVIAAELAELAEIVGVEQLQLNGCGGVTLTHEQYALLVAAHDAGRWDRDIPVCLHR